MVAAAGFQIKALSRYVDIMFKLLSSLVACGSICFILGCGKLENSPPVATVEGRITIAGQPLHQGIVIFMPAGENPGAPCSAQVKEGRYQVKNVPIGEVIVNFRALRPTGKMNTQYSTPIPEYENQIPEKYRNGINITVVGDTAGKDFDL